MKILFTASECVPFVKTGGLADVVGALAPVLAKEGHDVRVILPLYSSIPEKYTQQMTHVCDFEVQLGWRRQYCGIEMLKQDGVTWYFMDNKYYFGRPYIYGLGGDEYERYGFFCRGALNALPILDFQPDVIHAHDWQSGMVPALLKIQYAHLPFFANIKTMYTIHNLQYQGIFGIREVQDVLGLGDSLWTDDKLECYGCANFMKAALVYSDVITTVSPSYSEEIQTAYYGERLDGLLRARKESVHGILNGIDMVDYDPAIDNRIAQTYTFETLEGKAACKADLQAKLGLEVNPDIPVIGMVGRLSNQKGLDLVDYIMGDLMQKNVQLVVLGMGESRYVNLFSWAEGEYKGKVAARFTMDHALAHQIYAGCDMFLMPSQFEPCGLSQLIALRYGTVPIVRETGGLRDTVLSYNEYTDEGNGFSFFNYNAHDMLNTIQRAIDYYNDHKDVWKKLQERGMTGDYSWTNSAGKYLAMYEALVASVAKVEEAPVEEPKPKKTRTRKVKAEGEEAEKKPAARKPRAKKAEVTEEAAEAPVKKTRAKKAKAEEASAETAEAPVKKPRAPRKKKAEEPKAE
ncbi:MAG: glycogen synthase GlgA [Clostridia bacterium]|nr:glycogen synthase GlgA [Clostridia bacterium]